MPFISLEFLALVLVTLGVYYITALQKFQAVILVAASIVFYAWDQWHLLPLLLGAVLVTYLSMIGAIRRNRNAAIFGVSANLLILCFFKYKFLLIPNAADVRSGSEVIDFLLHLPLPIGISFFVFHNISLIVDYYKYGAERPRPSPLEVVLYILFFPQLVSGPITRALSFMPQIETKQFSQIPWVQAVELIITGLFFKLFCANNLAQATAMMSPEHFQNLGGGDKLFLIFAYSAQIYADFFGYSTMALGLALLFGYRLPVNFRLPYNAASFSDFWNRWHISLSTWLRNYLYFPLGGNKISDKRTYLNLMTVMILGGLWHGAALSYAVWGLVHGGLLVFERALSNQTGKLFPGMVPGRAFRLIYTGVVFVCVSCCWVLFRFQVFEDVITYFSSVVSDPFSFRQDGIWFLFTLIYLAPVALQHIVLPAIKFSSWPLGVRATVYGVMLWTAFAERGMETPFIYFQF